LDILKSIHFSKQFWFYFTAETQGREGGAEKGIFGDSEGIHFPKTILVFSAPLCLCGSMHVVLQ
jgi:hypothetical protein